MANFDIKKLMNDSFGGTPWNVPAQINRTGAGVFDMTTIFYSLSSAEKYAEGDSPVVSADNGKTYTYNGATAYPGQYIAVVDKNTGATTGYIIGGDRKLIELGAVNTSLNGMNIISKDGTTIPLAVSDNKIVLSVAGGLKLEDGVLTTAEISTISDISANLQSNAPAATSAIVEYTKKYGIEVEKVTTGIDNALLAKYIFKQGGTELTTAIDIPKDFLVKSAELKTCQVDGTPEGFKHGEKYIDFVLNSKDGGNQESHVYLNVNDLVDVYKGTSIDGKPITIDITDKNEISADIKDKSIATTHIALSAITSDRINGKAVTTGTIDDGAVTTEKIANSAVNSDKLAALAVTTDKIALSAVTHDKIADGAVKTDKIEDSAVTANKLGASAVTTDKIADKNVTTSKINDGAVTTEKIANNTITYSKLSSDVIDAFAATGHTHTASDITNLTTVLADYATNESLTAYVTNDALTSTTDGILTAYAKTESLTTYLKTEDFLTAYTTQKIDDNNPIVTSADVEDILKQVKPLSGIDGELVKVSVNEVDGKYQISATLNKTYSESTHDHDDKYSALGHTHALTDISNLTAYTTGSVGTDNDSKIAISGDVQTAITTSIDKFSDEVSAVSADIRNEIKTLSGDVFEAIALSASSTYTSACISAQNMVTTLSNNLTALVSTVSAETLLSAQDYVDTKIDDRLASFDNVFHFKGVVTALPTTSTTEAPYEVGDVILLANTSQEHVVTNVSETGVITWEEFGDQTTHATKTELNIVSTLLSDDLIAERDIRAADDAVLSTAIDNKIIIDGEKVDTLSVLHLTQDEFHERVLAGNLPDNELYAVTYDDFNVYGNRVINIGDPISANDATNKTYVDTAVKAVDDKVEELSGYTHALSVSQLVWDILEINGGSATSN